MSYLPSSPLTVFLSILTIFCITYFIFIIGVCYIVSDACFRKKGFWYWVKTLIMCDNDIGEEKDPVSNDEEI